MEGNSGTKLVSTEKDPGRIEGRRGELPRATPASALHAVAVKRRFLNEGALEVERNRYFVLLLAFAGLIAVLVFAIAALTPLKEVIPYVIETDDIGRTQAAAVTVERFTPTDAQVRYFLAEWVDHLMSVRPGVTQVNLPKAFRKTRGTAATQFREYLEEFDPLGQVFNEPDRITDTRIRSINVLGDNAVLIQFRTITREPRRVDETQDYSLTLNYRLQPPTTEEEILENPTGLQITNFNLTRELRGRRNDGT